MSELVATAERLRIVKDACMDFITRWAIDQMLSENRTSDRLYGDVLGAGDLTENNCVSSLYSGRWSDE